MYSSDKENSLKSGEFSPIFSSPKQHQHQQKSSKKLLIVAGAFLIALTLGLTIGFISGQRKHIPIQQQPAPIVIVLESNPSGPGDIPQPLLPAAPTLSALNAPLIPPPTVPPQNAATDDLIQKLLAALVAGKNQQAKDFGGTGDMS